MARTRDWLVTAEIAYLFSILSKPLLSLDEKIRAAASQVLHKSAKRLGIRRISQFVACAPVYNVLRFIVFLVGRRAVSLRMISAVFNGIPISPFIKCFVQKTNYRVRF